MPEASGQDLRGLAFFIDEAGWRIVENLAQPDSILVFDPQRPGIRDALPCGRFTTYAYGGKDDAPGLLALFADRGVRLGAAASFSRILPRAVFEAPANGTVNLHFGLLPAYRGANTLQWAIINGERQMGVTLHYMDAGVDTGPVIHMESVPVLDDDDALSVQKKCIDAGRNVLAGWLPRLAAGAAPARPQTESGARRWPRRKPEDGRIDWSRSDEEIRNLIRALVPPWPGAFYSDPHGRTVVVRRVLSLREIRELRRSLEEQA